MTTDQESLREWARKEPEKIQEEFWNGDPQYEPRQQLLIESLLKARAQGEKKGRRKVFSKFEELTKYLEHDGMCIRSFNEAGEPTPDGGYRQKFKGKWYQSRPVDETPKCDCGLDTEWEAFTKLKAENGK